MHHSIILLGVLVYIFTLQTNDYGYTQYRVLSVGLTSNLTTFFFFFSTCQTSIGRLAMLLNIAATGRGVV